MARVIDDTFKKTGAWFGEHGRRVYEWSTASGRQFDHSRLEVSKGEASIRAEPAEGTVGQLELVVDWSYGWFGKVKYKLRAYDAPIPPESKGLSMTKSSRLREHSGSWFGASGNEKIPFKIPADFTVQDVTISVQAGSAEISNHDTLIGATGSIEVEVSWSYGWFGHSGYFVTVLLVNSSISLSISTVSVTPDPGIAGEELKLSYTISNDGGIQINRVTEIIEIFAGHLEDVSDEILNGLPAEVRTSELGNEEIELNLAPRDNLVHSTSLIIPELVDKNNHISSAGAYDVTLRLTLGGVPLADSKISSFQVVKQ